MIEPPRQKAGRAAARTIAEALAQFTPITAGLARLYQFTHPTQMEKAVQEWQGQVSAAVNKHESTIQKIEDALAPRLEISETALELALWLTGQSAEGLTDPIDFSIIQEELASHSKDALEEACAELEHLGFVRTPGAIGHQIVHVRPEYELYWTFDPTLMKTNPTADAAELAKLMLNDDRSGSVPRLHEQVGWPKRRFNPAVARIIPLVGKKRVRRVIQNDYPTLGFILNSDDRFRLRRFIESAAQGS